MKLLLNNFFLTKTDNNTITQWISSFSNNVPKKILVIYGTNGIGKNSLAKCILQNYTVKYYSENNDIDDILLKYDISYMFTNKKYKSIIFDNIEIKDKSTMKVISSIIKNNKKYVHNPIIIIMDNNNYNLIKTKYILNNIIPICIHYNNTEWKEIINLYSKQFNCKINDYNNLLHISNYNLHNIINNIKFNGNKVHTIKSFDTDKSNIENQVYKLVYENHNINDIFLNYYNDSNVTILNIIDNIHNLLKTNDQYLNEDYINNILKLYEVYIYYDINRIYIHNEILLIYSIMIPYLIINRLNKHNITIKYNKYISNSIIYVTNTNIYKSIKNDNIIDHYYDIINNLNTSIDTFIYSINHNGINIKLLRYFVYLYNIINNKNLKYNITNFNKIVKNVI